MRRKTHLPTLVWVLLGVLVVAVGPEVSAQRRGYNTAVGFGMGIMTLGGDFDGSTIIDVSASGDEAFFSQDALAIYMPTVDPMTMYHVWFALVPFPVFQTTTTLSLGSGGNSCDDLTFDEEQGTAILDLVQDVAIYPLIRPRFKVGGYGKAGLSYLQSEATTQVRGDVTPIVGEIRYQDTEFLGYRLGLGAIGEFAALPTGRLTLTGRLGWSFAAFTQATAGDMTVNPGVRSNSLELAIGAEFRFMSNR